MDQTRQAGESPEITLLRAKSAAWDFLAHQGEVEGATLAEYLECAVVHACDETGHLLTRADSPLPAVAV